MSDRYGDWMQTYSGKKFWPLDPRADEIDIEDIAHALSMLCRYGGHSHKFYSVAEHCCHIHDALPDEFKAWGLLNDDSEDYTVDVPRPIKPHLPGYKEIERRVMQAVCESFGLDDGEPWIVKEYDRRILGDEQRQIMPNPPEPWYHTGEPLGITLDCWTPDMAKWQFMLRATSMGLS